MGESTACTLVIDQGTHASRALLVGAQGAVLHSCTRDVYLKRAQARVEQDATQLRETVEAALMDGLAYARSHDRQVVRAALATQRSTVVAWDTLTGEPLAPALSWQDTRTVTRLAGLVDDAREIARRTGLRLSAHYGASKLAWLLREVPAVLQAAERGRLTLGPLAAFLLFHLVEGSPRQVDHANASRTLLWNLADRDWDPWLLARFGIDSRWLPVCRPVRNDYGWLAAAPEVPITAVSGDQTAALFADGAPAADRACVNLGSGGFVLAITGAQPRPQDRLLAGLADSAAGEALFYLEGTINGAGAALSWARKRWQAAIPDEALDACLASAQAPPVFLNAVGGLGSPWWRTDLHPRLLDTGPAACIETPAVCIAAVLESIAFMVASNIEELRGRHGLALAGIKLSGGLSRIGGLCQRIADLSGLPVLASEEPEATARGAAWLAAGRPRSWTPASYTSFTAQSAPSLRARFRRFREAVEAQP